MAKKTTEPQEMTIKEVAEKLDRKPRSVLGLIKRGRFPNVRKLPGRTMPYLIPCSDFDEYLKYREARNKKRRQPVEETS